MRYLANVSNSVAIDDRLNYQQNKQCFAKNARMLLPDKLRHFGIWITGMKLPDMWKKLTHTPLARTGLHSRVHLHKKIDVQELKMGLFQTAPF